MNEEKFIWVYYCIYGQLQCASYGSVFFKSENSIFYEKQLNDFN